MNTRMLYSSATLLFCLVTLAAAATAPTSNRLRRNQGAASPLQEVVSNDSGKDDYDYSIDGNDLNDENVLTCRVTLTHTAFENEDGTMGHRYEHVCLPVVNGTQTPFMHPIEFPESFMQDNPEHFHSERRRRRGSSLFVAIHGAQINNRRMLLPENAKFTILPEDPTKSRRVHGDGDDEGRHLVTYPRQPYTDAIGDRILSLVTVSTSDASTKFSASTLKQNLFNQDADCLQSQWKKCSGGQFNWIAGDFINVQIPGRIGSYQTGGDAREEAIRQMKSKGLYRDDLQELGDNIIFVIAEGVREGFVANAAIDFFVATFSDKWGNDLRALSHELGHNFGLGHAGFGNDPYGDFSGYMASTSSPQQPEGPLMCFNAFNHYELKWFPSMSIQGSKKVRLTSFVNAKNLKQGDVVILEVNDEMFIQYNEASGFNKGSGAVPNKVVVVTAQGDETQRKAALDVGGTYTFGSTKVEVCDEEDGAMIVGVGTSNNLCNLPLENDDTGSDRPPENPDRAPRTPPTKRPKNPPPGQPGNRRPQPPRNDEPTLTCLDTSNRSVSFKVRGVLRSFDCSEIDERQCRKENLDNTAEFQRVFQVCEQECPEYTGCGRTAEDIQNNPRPCIRENRGKSVMVNYRGSVQELTCRAIGKDPNLILSLCPKTVIPDSFESKRPKVQDVCEFECADFLSCRII